MKKSQCLNNCSTNYGTLQIGEKNVTGEGAKVQGVTFHHYRHQTVEREPLYRQASSFNSGDTEKAAQPCIFTRQGWVGTAPYTFQNTRGKKASKQTQTKRGQKGQLAKNIS